MSSRSLVYFSFIECPACHSRSISADGTPKNPTQPETVPSITMKTKKRSYPKCVIWNKPGWELHFGKMQAAVPPSLFNKPLFSFPLLSSADNRNLQFGWQPSRQRRRHRQPADEAPAVFTRHSPAHPLVCHNGARPAAAAHPVLETLHHDRHHSDDRPRLLLQDHCPEAAAAPHPPAVRAVPGALDLGRRSRWSAFSPGEVCRMSRTSPQTEFLSQSPSRIGASVDLWLLG